MPPGDPDLDRERRNLGDPHHRLSRVSPEVKFRLMDSADRASFSGRSPSYTLFQQGAGRVDAYDAVHSTASGVTNGGLDLTADLLGLEHFRGPADAYLTGKGRNARYTYFIRDANGNPIEDDGYLWNGGYAYQDAFIWSNGSIWNDAYIWSDTVARNRGFIWSDLCTEALFTESWVPQE